MSKGSMNILWRKTRLHLYIFVGSLLLGVGSILLILQPSIFNPFFYFNQTEVKKYSVDTDTKIFTDIALERSGLVNFIDYNEGFIDVEFQDPHSYKNKRILRIFIDKGTRIDLSRFSTENDIIYTVQKVQKKSIRDIRTGQQIYFIARNSNNKLEALYISYGDLIL